MTWDSSKEAGPTPHEVILLIRKELESRDAKIAALELEIDRWKTASSAVKWGVFAVMGTLSAGASVWEWAKIHIK